MGILAHELRPGTRPGAVSGRPRSSGTVPGPVALLRKHGLAIHSANCASALAKVDQKKFDDLVHQEKPPSPSAVLPRFHRPVSESYKDLCGASGGTSVNAFAAFCEKRDAKRIARGLSQEEAVKVMAWVRIAVDWLDELEQHMPKPKP